MNRKEKLYAAGKKEMKKALGYIPAIKECVYQIVQEECEELTTKYIRDENGDIVDDYETIETFMVFVEDRLVYEDEKTKTKIAIICDDHGRLITAIQMKDTKYVQQYIFGLDHYSIYLDYESEEE